jgi:hypothetical protein
MSSEVVLHIYDLSQGMAKQFSKQFIGTQVDGIYHTGIVVYGKEFYYGGGISYDPPARTPFGPPTRTQSMGITEIPEDIFMEFLKEVSPNFTMNTYNVMENNCNNFTNECNNFLIGADIPTEIIDLPKIFMATPLGKMVAPMMSQF